MSLPGGGLGFLFAFALLEPVAGDDTRFFDAMRVR
jgi:hypothetical protein